MKLNQELKDLISTSFKNKNDIEVYNNYIDTLDNKNLPAILSFTHLADLLDISPEILARMCNSSEHFYRSFKIPKRSGGMRDIDAPLPALAEIQTWIAKNIVKNLEIDEESATAYEKNSSIKNHVLRHKNQPYLLKLDIKSFFPTIKVSRISKIFVDAGYSIPISYVLANLISLKGSLPQGAPTSPFISNVIVKNMDEDLRKFCNKHMLNYSRYADDLAFSGNELPFEHINTIEDIINKHGFSLNYQKKKLYTPGMKGRFLTGLVINGDEVRVPKATRKKIKQKVFYIKKYIFSDLGLDTDTRQNNDLFVDPMTIERIVGQLNFWKWIEPECKYVNNAIQDIVEIKDKLHRISAEFIQ